MTNAPKSRHAFYKTANTRSGIGIRFLLCFKDKQEFKYLLFLLISERGTLIPKSNEFSKNKQKIFNSREKKAIINRFLQQKFIFLFIWTHSISWFLLCKNVKFKKLIHKDKQSQEMYERGDGDGDGDV